MNFHKKESNVLWVFDLDGTLWEENSHVSIVEQYLGWKKYTNVIARFWYKINCPLYMKSLNQDYYKIPQDTIKSFLPHLVAETNHILKAAMENEERIVIISSAPREILEVAERLFSVKAYHASIGHKKEVLKKIGIRCDTIFVVTDNISDIDLISLSDKTYFRLRKEKYKNALSKYNDKVIYINN